MLVRVIHRDTLDRGVVGGKFADRPIASIDHAVFTKRIPNDIDGGSIKIEFPGSRFPVSRSSFDQRRDFTKNVLQRTERLNRGFPLARGWIARDRNIGDVIKDNGQAGDFLRKFSDNHRSIWSSVDIEGQTVLFQELEGFDFVAIDQRGDFRR